MGKHSRIEDWNFGIPVSARLDLFGMKKEILANIEGKIPTPRCFFQEQEIYHRRYFMSDRVFNPEVLNRSVHIVIQNKGGCGKTVVATIISQFFQQFCSPPLYCWDLEQSETRSFSCFKSLNVKSIKALDNMLNVDISKFDAIFNPILEGDIKDGIVVIDTGASSYHDMIKYIGETSDIPAILSEVGWRLILHSVIAGESLDSCLDGYMKIRSTLTTGYESIIWLNEYSGPTLKAFEGEAFKLYPDEFSNRSILLPKISTVLNEVFSIIRKEHLCFNDLKLFAERQKELKAEGKLPPNEQIIQTLDLHRIKTYLYGSSQGIPGIYTTLKNFDWSPHPVSAGPRQ